MGPEGIILVNPPITTFQQSLTHSALWCVDCVVLPDRPPHVVTLRHHLKLKEAVRKI